MLSRESMANCSIMKRLILLPLFASLLLSFQSCNDEPSNKENDNNNSGQVTPKPSDPDNPNNPEKPEDADYVTINDNGTTSSGLPFEGFFDDGKTEFILNHIKYKIIDDHLELIGCDEYEIINSLDGKAEAVPGIKKNGQSYKLSIVAESAFRDKKINAVILPNTVTEIRDRAFQDCNKLEKIKLPEDLTVIGDSAFYYCINLQDVSLYSHIKEIGKSAFSYCESMNSISIPEGVKILKEGTFNYCIKLRKIDLPSSLEEIGQWAFMDCKSLGSLVIPPSVKKISSYLLFFGSGLGTLSILSPYLEIISGKAGGIGISCHLTNLYLGTGYINAIVKIIKEKGYKNSSFFNTKHIYIPWDESTPQGNWDKFYRKNKYFFKNYICNEAELEKFAAPEGITPFTEDWTSGLY